MAREMALVSRVFRTLMACGTKLPVVRNAAAIPTHSAVALAILKHLHHGRQPPEIGTTI